MLLNDGTRECAGGPLLRRGFRPADLDGWRRRGGRGRAVSAAVLSRPGGAGGLLLRITIPKDRFAEAKAWLQERIQLLERDGDEFGAVELPVPYFAGTHGILLELIARHDLPAALSGRFTSADLLRMREIVLAAPDVALQNAFGLPAFGHRRGRVHPARRSQRAADLGPASPPWFPATTVTPSLGPIEVTAVRSPRRPRTPRRSPRGLLSHRRGPSVRSIWSRAILKD
jgi:hypothetical protein